MRNLSLNLKVLEYEQSYTAEPLSPSDLSLSFVSSSKQVLGEYAYQAQGITFLIDEIDVLENRVDLASFLKATVEKLRLDSYFSVNFIVSGVTGIATRLIMQHPSTDRLFEHLFIPRMSLDELMGIMDAALKDSETTITYEAKKRVARLANEFPQPVHLLGYHSYRIDSDNVLDDSDVEKSIQFITTNVRKQHFQSKFERIGAGIETEIVRAMAAAPLETVNMAYLSQRLPERTDRQILGAIGNLFDKLEIIEKLSRDQYRFREPLFKIYLRLLFKMVN